jgi:uncharacterized RDD family membrane protein YckC
MSQGYGAPDPGQPGPGQPGHPPATGYPPPPPGYGQPGYQPLEGPGTYMGRQLANWPQRVGAYLIDLLVYAVPVMFAIVLAGGGGGSGSSSNSGVVFLSLLVDLGLYLVNRVVLQGRTGQSWGKRILGLKLVRMADGLPVGAVIALVRDLLHTLDGLCLIGYLFPLWDPRRQTFADKIVNTVVLAGVLPGRAPGPGSRNP